MARPRKFTLTQEQRNELKVAYAQTKDGELRTRLLAVRLYGSGHTVADVQEITGCGRRTLTTWCANYGGSGIAGLLDKRVGGNYRLLDESQIADLQTRLHAYRPIDVLGPEGIATADGLHWTVSDLQQVVRQWYGVVYKRRESYHTLFAKCGFSYQRTAKQYRSRSDEQVTAFNESLEKN